MIGLGEVIPVVLMAGSHDLLPGTIHVTREFSNETVSFPQVPTLAMENVDI